MFQNFDTPNYNQSSNHLAKLRKWMGKNKIDVVLVPHNDEQRNEYLPKCAERLACITGFTGSAGTAIIMKNKAILFVDGRYTIQAKQQVKKTKLEIQNIININPIKWMETFAEKKWVMAIDPWLHSKIEIEKWKNTTKKMKMKLKIMQKNPIDEIWENQPKPPTGKVKLHDIKFAGKNAKEKIKKLRENMKNQNAKLCIINDASCVSWLFNIRGQDVEHTPLVLARAIVGEKKAWLFVKGEKIEGNIKKKLEKLTNCLEYNDFCEELRRLAKGAKVMMDTHNDPYAIAQIIEKAKGEIIQATNPIVAERSVKNKVEIIGARNAQVRDGAAVSTFLAWIDKQKIGSVDEISAAKKLENIRKKMAKEKMPLRDIAFDTISATGKNAAIVHYRVNKKSNKTLKNGELYLVDSGAQYDDGTTDITRTISIGKVGEEEKKLFTLVLKGHIAIQCIKFPKGTRGQDIDILARQNLWENGLDYQHGTGHGVGSYLSVHEGPQGISKNATEILKSGQIISNEPGVYKKHKFGIRIENLILVKENKEKMLEFENLTWVPIDQKLIDANALTKKEIKWINKYHKQVNQKLKKIVDQNTRKWLEKNTKPIKTSVK